MFSGASRLSIFFPRKIHFTIHLSADTLKKRTKIAANLKIMIY